MTISISALSEQELAAYLRNGNTTAFTVVYERYWKQLYVMASQRLGDEDEAEEVVQEIFLNLWRRRHTFSLTSSFGNYLAVAVKFEILDAMRKRAYVLKYNQELGNSFSEADETMLRQMDMAELQQKLRLTIQALPEKCQLVFRLKHEQGYTQKKIAEKLDISEKTVEAHLAKARKILRSEFGCLLGAAILLYTK